MIYILSLRSVEAMISLLLEMVFRNKDQALGILIAHGLPFLYVLLGDGSWKYMHV